ncbi:hypothetical protein DEO72_LG6g1565 [Vigna unguiculata]|uniref:Uncharacterized protein n=1 Tax=Vigna unguiculata TaxID=3917 RepID=A0A4D6M6H9_VIGUN|nr:hypothetical protein DEO72_LG6g1565 [Vigna unguiculata]
MDSSCKVLGHTTMAARTYSGARDKDDSRAAAVVVRSRSWLHGGVSDERLLVCCCSILVISDVKVAWGRCNG